MTVEQAGQIHKLIIVDDEEDIIVSLRGFLSSLATDIEVLSTTDPLEVAPLLEQHPDVEFIITDIRMPNLSGLDLMVKVQQTHPGVRFIIMTGFSSPELQQKSLRMGALRYLEKPFDFNELNRILHELISQQSGFKGTLEQLQLFDVIQLLGLSGRKSTLKVRYGDRDGIIVFDNGSIVHAKCGELIGEAAFQEMFCWPGGSFHIAPYQRNSRSIGRSWQVMVLDAARIADETSAGVGGGFVATEEEEEPEEEIPEEEIVPPASSSKGSELPEVDSLIDEFLSNPPPLEKPAVVESPASAFSFPAPLSYSEHPAPAPTVAAKPVVAERKLPEKISSVVQSSSSDKLFPSWLEEVGERAGIALHAGYPGNSGRLSASQLAAISPLHSLQLAIELFNFDAVKLTVSQLQQEYSVEDATTIAKLQEVLAGARIITYKEWLTICTDAVMLESSMLSAPVAAWKKYQERTASDAVYWRERAIACEWLDPALQTMASDPTCELDPTAAQLPDSERAALEERWLHRLSLLAKLAGHPALPASIAAEVCRRLGNQALALGIEIAGSLGVLQIEVSQLEEIRAKFGALAGSGKGGNQ